MMRGRKGIFCSIICNEDGVLDSVVCFGIVLEDFGCVFVDCLLC